MSRASLIERMNRRHGSSLQIITDNIVPDKDMQVDPTLSKIEYALFELNSQATKPFIAQYFNKTFFKADTNANVGDLILRNDTNTKYLVTVKNVDVFKGNIVRNLGICYLCNSQVVIDRKETTEDETTLEMITSWNNVCTNVNCLVTEGFYGEEVENVDYGDVTTDKQEMYIQNKSKVELGDRVTVLTNSSVFGGEKVLYVRKIKRRFYSGIDYCILTRSD